jgi:hypothetical protein
MGRSHAVLEIRKDQNRIRQKNVCDFVILVYFGPVCNPSFHIICHIRKYSKLRTPYAYQLIYNIAGSILEKGTITSEE